MTTRRLIRYASGAALLLAVVGVVVMAVHRGRILTGRVAALSPERILPGDERDPVSRYSGFEFVERVAGKLIFALDSARTLGFESGWHELEGFRLQLYDDDGSRGPVITCERASFNVDTKDARLEGGIQVGFADGGILTTASGRFDASRRRFETETAVTYTDGVRIGEAASAVYLVESDRLDLERSTLVDAVRGVTLRAPEILYRRGESVVVLPSGARILTDLFDVTGGRGRVDLDPEGSGPVRLGLWDGVDVRGRTAAAPVSRATADRIVAERDAAGGWQIVSHGDDGRWMEAELGPGPGHYFRRLRTFLLRASIDPGGIRNLRAERGVCLDEIPVEGAPRHAEAERGTVWFEEGAATDVELERDVEVRGEGAVARGHRARVAAARRLVMLFGDPAGPERAVVVTDRGRISCDQVHMFDAEQRIEARGDVQGELREVAMIGAEAGGDSAAPRPLLFAAEALELVDGGDGYRLEGTARAWQGSRLLLADEIAYRRGPETLQARGHVRTVFPSAELAGAGAEPGGEDPQETAGEGGDVVVTARSLDYDGLARLAVYRGSVRYSDERHTLAATELAVRLGEDGALQRIEATGAVEIVDMATGRRMTGSSAVRDVASSVIIVEGTPAQLTDDRGNVVSGASLTWSWADGSVAVAGDTETIFYPEEEE